MLTVARHAIVPYSAAHMYALVADIERYPEFLRWCSNAEILSREGERTVATIHVSFRGVRQQFTTENRNAPAERIDLQLVRGPFRSFRGQWQFMPLDRDACKVELRLAYQFANPIIGQLAGSVFEHIANTFVDAFVRRADALHGK